MDNLQRLDIVLTHMMRDGMKDDAIMARVGKSLAHLRDVLPKEQGGSRVALESRPRGRGLGVAGSTKKLTGSLDVVKKK